MLGKAWWIAMFAACSSPARESPAPARTSIQAADGNVPRDASVAISTDTIAPIDAAMIDAAAQPVASSCPASFTAAAGTCVPAASCSYPQGTCSCTQKLPCTGVPAIWENARRTAPFEWTCVPTKYPNGCPGQQPAQGSPCKVRASTECSYAHCGGVVLACRKNVWTMVRMVSPPP
ncbi:MAG TPA: hypothetical protein VL326_29645 [Kofleriaceae bacterium]|nr:hypothetical protein [Kofleriaceae bacterium]